MLLLALGEGAQGVGDGRQWRGLGSTDRITLMKSIGLEHLMPHSLGTDPLKRKEAEKGMTASHFMHKLYEKNLNCEEKLFSFL